MGHRGAARDHPGGSNECDGAGLFGGQPEYRQLGGVIDLERRRTFGSATAALQHRRLCLGGC